MPDNIKPYFDFEAYVRDISINENGHFAPVSYTHLDVYKRQRQNEGADHDFAGRVERETAARTGAAGQEKGLGEVTGPRFWTLCPEVNAPRRGWALW